MSHPRCINPEQEQQVVSMYRDGEQQKDIASFFSITSSSVGRCLARNGVVLPVRNKDDLRYQDAEWLREQILSQKTLAEIGEMCGVTSGAVLRFQLKHNLQRRVIGGHSRFKTLGLTLRQRSVINGCLLGDGYVSRAKANGQVCCLQVSSTKPSVAKELSSEFVGLGVVSSRNPLNERDNVRHEFRVSGTEIFEERLRWYPEGVKIVPRDLVLDALAIRYWHIGDGGIARSSRQSRVYLCTDSFLREDNLFLISLLSSLGIQSTCPTGGRNRIWISAKSYPTYFNLIGEPIEGYEHRWL